MVKNFELQIVFLQFYRIFPPQLEYRNILYLLWWFFGFISLVVLLRRQFCGGVGRVGKIAWRPLSDSGPARRSPAQIRKLEPVRPSALMSYCHSCSEHRLFVASFESAPSVFLPISLALFQVLPSLQEDATESLVFGSLFFSICYP